MTDCIFCKIAGHEIPSQVVYEDEYVLAFKDLKPVAPMHVLVIPKKHVSGIADAGDEDAELMGRILLAVRTLTKDDPLAEDGYRVIINQGEKAGQSVFHLHVHVLAGRPMGWPPG